MRQCECCPAQAVKGERFCKACKKVRLSEMKKAGYLTPAVRHGSNRTADQKELVHETAFGNGH